MAVNWNYLSWMGGVVVFEWFESRHRHDYMSLSLFDVFFYPIPSYPVFLSLQNEHASQVVCKIFNIEVVMC